MVCDHQDMVEAMIFGEQAYEVETHGISSCIRDREGMRRSFWFQG